MNDKSTAHNRMKPYSKKPPQPLKMDTCGGFLLLFALFNTEYSESTIFKEPY